MSPEIKSSARDFEKLVSPDTIRDSGFTPDLAMKVNKNKEVYEIRYAFVSGVSGPTLGLHLVVGERLGEKRNWYFGTFQGPSWERMSQEETEKYTDKVMEILQRKNIVGRNRLDDRIRKAMSFFLEREFPLDE